MYVRDGQLNDELANREHSIVLRPSQRFHYTGRPFLSQSSINFGWSPTSHGLGGPPPPKGLKLLDHFHVPKKPDPTTPGHFIVSQLTKVDVTDLNPGFIDPSDNVITDSTSDGLQTCLNKLITNNFQNYLSKASNTAATVSDRLRVALVDLTGDKISRPDFAGWGSTLPMYGASVPKMLAVYAAHQLRMDLRQLAFTPGILTAKDLEKTALKTWNLSHSRPDLVWLFDIRKWNGTPGDLDFTTAAKNVLAKISKGHNGGKFIVRVGFPYIHSITFQSGLFHPTRGGLWLTTSYRQGKSGSNPVKAKYNANVTALSAATFFTLLAQRRMIDPATSADIQRSLFDGGCITRLITPLSSTLGGVAAKCGVYRDYWHDCVLVDRADARYVVIVLTRTKKSEEGKYMQLVNELDKLIVRNNQKPKPGC